MEINCNGLRDAFEANIYRNLNISDSEQLNYLLSKLSGEAKRYASGILLSNKNYAVGLPYLGTDMGSRSRQLA